MRYKNVNFFLLLAVTFNKIYLCQELVKYKGDGFLLPFITFDRAVDFCSLLYKTGRLNPPSKLAVTKLDDVQNRIVELLGLEAIVFGNCK